LPAHPGLKLHMHSQSAHSRERPRLLRRPHHWCQSMLRDGRDVLGWETTEHQYPRCRKARSVQSVPYRGALADISYAEPLCPSPREGHRARRVAVAIRVCLHHGHY